MEAKAFSFTRRTKVFAAARYGRAGRDLRRTSEVPGGTGVSEHISEAKGEATSRQ